MLINKINMKKLYTHDKKNFLVYHKQQSSKNKAPSVIFLHGLMSNMDGGKAIATENYCREKNYDFIRFDNFGHGQSSGKFTDYTMSDWLRGLNLIIEELADGPFLLVGSSMGAWLAILAAKLHPKKIIGVVTLASALDFTEKIIWNSFSQQERQTIKKEGVYDVCGSNKDCDRAYPISYNLIIDGRKHLLLDKEIDVSCPVSLIHGMRDIDVPYNISMRMAEKLKSEQVTVKLIKDADHHLSRPEDLQVLYNSIDEVLGCYVILSEQTLNQNAYDSK